MWIAYLFPFHCLPSEGREVNKHTLIPTLPFFLSFFLQFLGLLRAVILTDEKRFSSELE